MRRFKWKINKNVFLLQLEMILLVPPAWFLASQTGRIIYCTFAIVAFITLFIKYICRIKKKDHFCLIWILAFYGWILFSSIINNKSIIEYVNKFSSQMALCMFFLYHINKNKRELFQASKILDAYIFINLATILLFPNGLYSSQVHTENWFLGYKNPQIRTILPIICFSIIRSYEEKDSIGLYQLFIFLLSLVTTILNKSATSLLVLVIFFALVLSFVVLKKRVPHFFSLNKMCGIISIISIAIVAFNIQYVFSYIIENILERNLTFTSRTRIWPIAINRFLSNPIIGYGAITSNDFSGFFGRWIVSHPHNYLLYIVMSGGIILFLILLLGIRRASINLTEFKHEEIRLILLITIVCFAIMGIAESLTEAPLLYTVLILAMEWKTPNSRKK